jgi:hypothetical protein
MTFVFLLMGFALGAANTGVAVFWAWLRKSQPRPLAAFNFGLGVFLAVQIAAEFLMDYDKAGAPNRNASGVESESTIGKR